MCRHKAFEQLDSLENKINVIVSALADAEYRYAGALNRGPLIGINLSDSRSYIQELERDLGNCILKVNVVLKALNWNGPGFPSDMRELKSWWTLLKQNLATKQIDV